MPRDLGFMFSQQSPYGGVPLIEERSNPLLNIGAMLAEATGNVDQRRVSTAQARLANEQATDLSSYRTARQRLGELIAQQFAVNAEDIKRRAAETGVGVSQHPDGYTVLNPNGDERLAVERDIATERFTPTAIAAMLAERVQAGDASAAGGDIGDILANMAVTTRDADSAAGYRGTALNPGQSVFESGARATNEYNQGQETARNDADNTTTERGQDIDARTRITAANIAATVQRESNAATDRASRTALELSRAARLDNQTVNAAITAALGIRRGENVTLPAEFRPRVIARTTELLRQNENLDATTAATMAIDELTDEQPAAEGFLGIGRHNRRFQYTEAGAAYRPSAATPAPAATTTPPTSAATFPPGSQVDDETGIVYDAQGNVIGRLNR